jgi:Tol biopolymer transport system component
VTRSIVAALLLVAAPARAASLYDPDLTWRTIETRRFAVHYPDGARNLAVRVAREAETVLDGVAKLFGHVPDGRIEIVLSDASDGANGSAQVMPKNIIRLFVTAPTELTGLSSYDDWIRILLIHEIAHICDIDQTHGLTRLFRFIFGKYIQMNGLVPQFLSEGVAVWAETLLTPTGRGRSTYVDTILRTAALDGTFISIDQANIQLNDWPGPSSAYFYGGLFHLWLTEKYGPEAVRDLHTATASMPLPYIYWPPSRIVFGKSLTVLWDEWRAEVLARAQKIEAEVVAEGVTPSRRITTHGRNITGSQYSPDGATIIYSRTSPVDGATVRRIGRDGKGDHHLVLETFSSRFSFSPDGKSFYFSQGAVNERWNDFDDLYRYDFAGERTTRLRDAEHPEKSLRARDPDVSPDGKRLVFVQNRLHQSWVTLATFEGDDQLRLRTLVPPEGDTQHASPRFSPDGKSIAVSTWMNGKRDIFLVDAETGALQRRITDDPWLDGYPAWSPDGRYLLYESDADGISNIYAHELATGRYFRVTRVIGGAYQADVANDGAAMLFRNASGIGFDIHEMPFAPESWESLEYIADHGYTKELVLSAAGPIPPDTWGRAQPRDTEPPLPLAAGESDESYSPWSTLLPFQDNWLLLPAIFLQNGDPSFAVATLGQDVLAEHLWVASAGSSLALQHLNWSALYVNDSWDPTFAAGYSDQAIAYPSESLGFLGERRRTVQAGVSLPIFLRHLFALTWAQQRREAMSDVARAELGPDEDFAWFEFGYTYRLARRFPYSVGDEHGVHLSASGRWYNSATGGDFDELMLTLDGRAYVNNPLFDNHVLALRAIGAVALGPDYEEQFALGGAQGQSLFTVETPQTYPLRGFPLDITRYPRGTGVAAAYVEYRFPLLQIDHGLWTLPVYFERVHAAVFAEGGNTFSDLDRAWARLRGGRLGAGGEVRADLSLGWAFPLTFRVGVATPVIERGLLRSAAPQLYLSFGSAI